MAFTRRVTREVVMVLAWVPDSQPSELVTEKDLLALGFARPGGDELKSLAWFRERWDPTISKLHGLEYQLKQQAESHAREMLKADEANGKLLREQEQLRAHVAELEAERARLWFDGYGTAESDLGLNCSQQSPNPHLKEPTP